MHQDSEIECNYTKILVTLGGSMAIGSDGDLLVWGKSTLFGNQVKLLPTKMNLPDQYLFYRVVHLAAGLNHCAAILKCQLKALVPIREMKGSILAIIAEQAKKLNESGGCDRVINYFNKKRYLTIHEFRNFYLLDKQMKSINYSYDHRPLINSDVIPNQFEQQLLALKSQMTENVSGNHQMIDLLYYYQQLLGDERSEYKTLVWGSTTSGRLGLNLIQYQNQKLREDTKNFEMASRIMQSRTLQVNDQQQIPDNEILKICCLNLQQQFIKISCGHHHSIAITSEYSLFVWGMGGQGCLGTGRIDDIRIPTELKLGDNVIEIAAGAFSSMVILESKKVYAWGVNVRGQLGVGNKENQLTPSEVTFFKQKHIVPIKLFAGDQHSAAVSEAKELFTWGNGDYYRLGHGMLLDELEPKKVEVLQDVYIMDVALGTAYSLCITNEGFVYAWGCSKDNVLGIDKEQYEDQMLPLRVGLSSTSFKKHCYIAVTAGMSHSMALTNSGILYSWGLNKRGLLGVKLQGVERTFMPQKIEQCQNIESTELNKVKFYIQEIQVKTNIISPMDMFNIQSAYAKEIQGDHLCEFKYAVAGTKNTLMIDKLGKLYGCGSNESGILCKNPQQKQTFKQLMPKDADQSFNTIAYTPIMLEFFRNVQIKFVSCQYEHAIAITSKGSAYCWGKNSGQQLGLGFSSNDIYTPLRLAGALEQKKLVMSVCGDKFSGVVTQEGEVWTFGTSENGVLGHEIKNYYVINEPRMINDIEPVVYLTCSNQTMMAITEKQELLVWGNNQFGQLGISLERDEQEVEQNKDKQLQEIRNELKQMKNPDVYIIYQPQTVPIRSLTGDAIPAQVACGLFHSVVLTTTQDILSCGLVKYAGQIVNEPDGLVVENKLQYFDVFSTLMPGIKFTHIAAHEKHSLALTTNGEIIGWGDSMYGKLGTPKLTDNELIAKQAKITVSNGQLLVCGPNHSLAIQKSGLIYTWGSTLSGKLGINYEKITKTSLPMPSQITCYTCVTKANAVDKPKEVTQSKSTKHSKKKHGKKNNQGNLDVELEDEEVLDEMSFDSEEGEGHTVQDPLQKDIQLQSQECQAENLYLQDADIERKIQFILKDAALQALQLSNQYDTLKNKIETLIDHRAQGLALLNNCKTLRNLKFSVPQFIVKNIQLFELMFSCLYYHPCYVIKIIQINQLNKYQVLRFIKIIYKNDLMTNSNNQAIIMTLAIKSFESEFNNSQNQQEYISELKVFKNQSVFLQIYQMFLEKDAIAYKYFSTVSLNLITKQFFERVHQQLLGDNYDAKQLNYQMVNYFTLNIDKNDPTIATTKYTILADIVTHYVQSIIDGQQLSRISGDAILSDQCLYIHNSVIHIIKSKLIQQELMKLESIISVDQQGTIGTKLKKYEIVLNEKINKFLINIYYGSITTFIYQLSEQVTQFSSELRPFLENEQNLRMVMQGIDRFFQSDSFPPSQTNQVFNELVMNKTYKQKSYMHIHDAANQLQGITQFSVENLNILEVVAESFQFAQRNLQVEVQDILTLLQFYNSQLHGGKSPVELFIRGIQDPIFIVLRHLEFREISINLFSTEILKRKINLKLMANPLMQLVSVVSENVTLYKCEHCKLLLTNQYISHTKQKKVDNLMSKGWKCRLGHYNQISVLDCEALGCSQFINEEALSATRILKYYCRVNDDNIDMLIYILGNIDTIPRGIDMYAQLNTLANSSKIRKNEQLCATILTFISRLTPKDIKQEQISQRFLDNYDTVYQRAHMELQQRQQHRKQQISYNTLLKTLEQAFQERVIEMTRILNSLQKEEQMLCENIRILKQGDTIQQSVHQNARSYGFYTSAKLRVEGVLVRLTFQNKEIAKLQKNIKFYFIGQSDGGWVLNLVYLQDDIFNMLVPCVKTIYPIEIGIANIKMPIGQYIELRRLTKFKNQITFNTVSVELTFNSQKLMELFKYLDSRMI